MQHRFQGWPYLPVLTWFFTLDSLFTLGVTGSFCAQKKQPSGAALQPNLAQIPTTAPTQVRAVEHRCQAKLQAALTLRKSMGATPGK